MLTAAGIKRIQRLRDDDRARRDENVFIVEGDKAVRDFLQSGRFAGELLATPDWTGRADATHATGITVREISAQEMARISHLPSPSTALALFLRPAPADPAPLHGLALALDAVQDPGNVGTLLRIADWFGFGPVLLGEGCADPYAQKVVNASKGSLARVTVLRTDLPAALRAADLPVLGCDLEGENVHTFAPPPAAVVVIGSEGRGLSPAVQACVTRRITIPAFGGAESLNAAVAAAVICDNLRRNLATAP